MGYGSTVARLRSTWAPPNPPAGAHSVSQKFVAPATGVNVNVAVPSPDAFVVIAAGLDGVFVPGGQVPGFCSTHTSKVELASAPLSVIVA